jgi:hypothetical protein
MADLQQRGWCAKALAALSSLQLAFALGAKDAVSTSTAKSAIMILFNIDVSPGWLLLTPFWCARIIAASMFSINQPEVPRLSQLKCIDPNEMPLERGFASQ